MTKPAQPAPAGVLLYGMNAIAAFLGVTPRQAYHLADKAAIPTWKVGKTVCASRATLTAWIAEREGAARG